MLIDTQSISKLLSEKPEISTAFDDTVESGLTVRLPIADLLTFAYRNLFSGKSKRFSVGKFPVVIILEARKKKN